MAPLAAVAALHVLAVAGLLSMPAARERFTVASPVFVEYRVAAREPVNERGPLPRPVLREPAPVMIAPPSIALAPEIAVTTPGAPPPEVVAPMQGAMAAGAAEPAPIESPRFDMAYLKNPPPAYPSLSRRMKEQGRVILRVLVNVAGEAQDVEVRMSSGSERLDRAAMDAVRRWRFAPARRGAETIAAYALVPIVFQLDA
jgi:protein TonB